MAQSEEMAVCEMCGERALVRVLVDYVGNERVVRHYCLACADHEQPRPPIVRPFVPKLLLWLGFVLGALTVSADYLGIDGKPGFGWRQLAGVELGALLMVLGVLLRTALLSVGGLVLLIVSAAADWLSVGHFEGVGPRQMWAMSAAGALILVALIWKLIEGRLAARETDSHGPAPR